MAMNNAMTARDTRVIRLLFILFSSFRISGDLILIASLISNRRKPVNPAYLSCFALVLSRLALERKMGVGGFETAGVKLS